MKKIISLLLLAAMVTASMLAGACAQNSANITSATDNTENVTTLPEETTILMPEVPEKDYESYEFKVLVSANNEQGIVPNDIGSEGETGEVINDARFRRNTAVEDQFNIKITDIVADVGDAKGYEGIKKSAVAGDNAYDAAMVAGYASCKLAAEGYLSDLNSVPYIDLTKPWWDQKANADLTIKGRMFYTTGSISTAINDATYCILFNKKLIGDYNLGNMYELVQKGTWTIDKFIEYTSQIHSDLDGNGKFDTNDLFGALVWDDTMMGIVNATGDKCATVNADGEIELTLYTDKVVDMFNKYTGIVYQKDVCLTYQRKNWDGIASNNMFANNQALFYLQLLRLVALMRNMTSDFGILPYFKYEEAQESYYSTVGSWHSIFLTVPVSNADIERTGIVLESMAAQSMYNVTPAYYDIALKDKYTRDEESKEMLDIILSTRVFDLGWFYQFGGYNEEVMNQLRNFKADFVSMYTKNENRALAAIEKINNTFGELFE